MYNQTICNNVRLWRLQKAYNENLNDTIQVLKDVKNEKGLVVMPRNR